MVLRVFIGLLLLVSGAVGAMEIRTAAQDSAPKFVALGNNVAGGLCVDIMRAIEKIDPSIRFVGENIFVPFKRIEIQLANSDIDVFFGFTRNQVREGLFRFIDIPLYKVSYVMAVRKDDPITIKTFDDVRALKSDSTIMALFGTADIDYLNSVGGLTLDSSGRNPQAMLEKLVANRGRFVYYHRIGLNKTIGMEGMQDKVRILPVVFKEESHYAAFSKKAPAEMVSAVTSALKKLKENGQLQAIFNAYDQTK